MLYYAIFKNNELKLYLLSWKDIYDIKMRQKNNWVAEWCVLFD